MKKILLGTTTLVGAAALFAGAAFAGETPKVTIGGTIDVQAGFVNEDRSAGTGGLQSGDGGYRAGAFRTETELSFKIDAKTDSGLGYGGEIVMPVDSAQNPSAVDQVGREFVYAEGAWGRLEGGTNTGATAALKIDASSIASATGGIDGDWTYFMSPTTGAGIYTPDAVLDHGTTTQFGDESAESINKVTYYTPRFMGFQAGVSYLFDTKGGSRGRLLTNGTNSGLDTRRDNVAGNANNVVTGGVNYEGKFSDVSVGLAATGEYGTGQTSTTNNLHSYNLGAKLGYMGFSLAGSYGSWGDSLSTLTTGASEAKYWTLGGAYELGAFSTSVTYLNSQYNPVGAAPKNKFDNLSIGADYKLAPGFTPYAEVSFASVNIGGGSTNDNDATIFIAGTQLAF